jgi:predicted alpha-1,6-mannanase (GH76 family)
MKLTGHGMHARIHRMLLRRVLQTAIPVIGLCTVLFAGTAQAAEPSVPVADRDATTALVGMYDSDTGLWPSTGWWNAANDVTALADYGLATHSHQYDSLLANTFDKNKSDNFTNSYIDDTGWWGLAWVRAYDLTHQQRYLTMAITDADYMYSYWDDTCGGGVWWSTAKTYKNAIPNELFLKLTAELHNRIPHDKKYLGESAQEWKWFQASGMINSDHLINDGLDATTCKNNNGTTWTYNQGVILGGLVDLHQATGDPALLRSAQQIADAATSSNFLNPNGILTEPCEANNSCGGDGPSFKGIFARNLGELNGPLHQRYRTYLVKQAKSAIANDRNDQNQYGLRWAGPFDQADGARQHSALDLLTAARG